MTPQRITKGGGAERHISVWNGLQALDSQDSEFIAIHDGARVSAVFPHLHRRPSRPFVGIGHLDGQAELALEGPPADGRNVADLAALPG